MRVGIVLAATMLVGACASLVDLDKADDPAQSSATSSSSGEAKSKTDGGGQSSSSGGSSGTASSSGGTPATDAGADAAPKIPDSCTKNEDCPQDDDNHDRCSNAGKCTKTCVKEGTPCFPGSTELPCCFGLVCKDPPVGSIDLCQPP